MRNKFILLLFCFSSLVCFSASTDPDIKQDSMIVKYDFSVVFTCDSITSADSVRHEHAQPLGYWGLNYDRLKIHYDSIVKHPAVANKYLAYGETQFDHKIVFFVGELKITKIEERTDSRYPGMRMGLIHGTYKFSENKEQKSSGIYAGRFTSNWLINDSLGVVYDALDYGQPHFKNNQFRGYWKSYLTGAKQKSCWGDYRIPNSAEFDQGRKEFIPDQKHKHKGWDDYIKEHEDPSNHKAFEHEHEHWWENTHVH